MRNRTLIGLAIVSLVVFATAVVVAFAQSPPQTQNDEPRAGYTYYVIYDQTNGFIVLASACPPSPAYCVASPQPGQSVIYITDQPSVVKQLFGDGHNGRLGNWHVDLQTHQLASTGAPSSASALPSAFGLTLVGVVLPTSASIGVVTSGALIWRRARRHSNI